MSPLKPQVKCDPVIGKCRNAPLSAGRGEWQLLQYTMAELTMVPSE